MARKRYDVPIWLWYGLPGAIFGFGQLARGAHFVSHQLWLAAIRCPDALVLYAFVFRGHLHPELVSLSEGDLPR